MKPQCEITLFCTMMVKTGIATGPEVELEFHLQTVRGTKADADDTDPG